MLIKTNKEILKKGFGDFKNKWLKLEDIVIGQQYPLTLNPREQPEDNTKKGLYIFYRKMYTKMLDICYRSSVKLILHYEQSPTARSHFHGMITVTVLPLFGEFVRMIEEDFSSEMDTFAPKAVVPSVDSLQKHARLAEPAKGTREYWTEVYIVKQDKIWKDFFKAHTCVFPLVIPNGMFVTQIDIEDYDEASD